MYYGRMEADSEAGINGHCIARGKPLQNGDAESCNGPKRDELRHATLFMRAAPALNAFVIL